MIHAFGAMIHQIFVQLVQEKPGGMNTPHGSAGQNNHTLIVVTPKCVCHSLAEK